MIGVNRFHQHSNNLKRNLISHFTYDNRDTSGTTLIDVHGGYDATLTNTPTTGSSGLIREAYDFDSSLSEYLNCGDIPEMENVSSISVNIWLNSSAATGDRCFISKYQNPAPGSWELAKNATQVFWRTWNASGTQDFLLTSSVSFIDGNWHMLTATYDNGEKYLYLDGGSKHGGWEISSSAAAGNIRNTGYPVNIARRAFSGAEIYYTGSLELTSLWSGRVIQQKELDILWNEGEGFPYRYWT